MDIIIGFIIAVLFCFPNLGISWLYYLSSKNRFLERILVSAHGFIFILIAPYSSFLGRSTSLHNYEEWMLSSLRIFIIFGCISVVYSFFRFKGNKLIHLCQLANIPMGLVMWFLGILSITHDSM